MQRGIIYRLLLILPIFLILQFKPAFAQGSSENLSTGSIKEAIKKAIKETDEEKEAGRAQIAADLKSQLALEGEKWIALARQRREGELNKFQHQAWDLAGTIKYPVPYDYYLRGYDYSIIDTDLKHDSLDTSYKANINISEKLYVEGQHSSSASDIKQYFYTLTRPVILSLEYKQSKFIVTNAEYGLFQIESGWQKY